MASLASDPIFVALTRPQMLGGVTYGYAVFNLIITIEAFLVTKSFWALPVALLVHFIGYAGCLRDPRFFDLWLTKVRTCPRIRNHRFWSTNAYQP
jgi:type IV secretion system protein VirB3